MSTLKILCLSVLSITSGLVFAESYTENIPDINDNPSQLQSIPMLQSLRNVQLEKEYRAPHVQELKNRNGVRTLFVESQDLPMVDIQLTFNAGAARDEEVGKGLFGTANMAARLMDEGTEKYNAAEIASVFDQSGAQMSIQAHRDMFVMRLRVLSDPKKLEPALGMMMEILKNATFKNSSISLALSNNQAGQKQLQESPSRLMGIRFNRELYGTHPYAEPITGTNGSIKRITPEILKTFRDKFLVAQNMNIAITGKLSTKEAQNLAERVSGNLRQGEKAKPLAAPVEKNGFNIVYMPFNSTQANVMFGHLGTIRNNPDRLALEVANRMFGGGGFNSILMQELRIKRGYTYGAYSSFSFSQSPGTFSFSYGTRQDQLVDSIKVAHKAYVDFVKKPIDAKQLEETKAGMLRAFPNNYSSNSTINAQLGLLGFYNQPTDYLSQYPKLLEKITVNDVQQAVQKYMHPEDMTVIVVSQQLDKEQLKHILQENLGTTPEPKQLPSKVAPLPMPATDVPAQTPSDKRASI
ncbi:insulinase family protein [uncultured Acinetobacter sp.]|uniref:insulinase family protein n=1 Tax=Acinetobacter gandensis TaxID=1443941 RepID=UPI0025914FFD|nr:pitrilysin family protein [uncultured Acinetobacter sp.]